MQRGGGGQQIHKGWEGGIGERGKEPGKPPRGNPESLPLGQHSHCQK